MKELEKIAWENLNKNSKEINNQTIVTPTEIGKVYPLTPCGGDDFIGVYLGNYKLYKDSPKKMIFAIKDMNENYNLFSSKKGLMLWHTEGDDGPQWPAGISVDSEGKANEINKKAIDNKFRYIFDNISQSKINEQTEKTI